jgi:class 3 adenylate cyclase
MTTRQRCASNSSRVSVLFVDVVGFTAIGQQLGPEEVHGVMDGALQRFTASVQKQDRIPSWV